jgi:hypothetical protein
MPISVNFIQPYPPLPNIINVFVNLRSENTKIFIENANIFAKMRKRKFLFQSWWQLNSKITRHMFILSSQNAMLNKIMTPQLPCMHYHCQIPWDFRSRENFCEFSWKLAHFRMIFAFSRKLKNAFRFNPNIMASRPSYNTVDIQ